MAFWSVNDEQRMVLRLSELAVSVMEEDNLNYSTKSPSDFFCRVFENYYESSNASIGRVLVRQTEQLHTILGEQATPAMLKALNKHKEAELLALQEDMEKGSVQVPIRLQNKAMEKLLDCEAVEGAYYSWPRLYMQAVLEEYFRLPSFRRERIYFAERFGEMENALAEHRQMRITTRSGNVFLIHPCELRTDKLDNGWYLAGYSRLVGSPISEKRPASFRVAHLKDVEILRDKAVVSAQDRKELSRKIQTQGVQFLTENPRQILVRMSPKGARTYADMMTMRPSCQNKDGDIWEFNCTRLQALRYFCRMASDCEILAPAGLRRDMAKFLRSSAKKYEKE